MNWIGFLCCFDSAYLSSNSWLGMYARLQGPGLSGHASATVLIIQRGYKASGLPKKSASQIFYWNFTMLFFRLFLSIVNAYCLGPTKISILVSPTVFKMSPNLKKKKKNEIKLFKNIIVRRCFLDVLRFLKWFGIFKSINILLVSKTQKSRRC